jgi:hypothetical protein
MASNKTGTAGNFYVHGWIPYQKCSRQTAICNGNILVSRSGFVNNGNQFQSGRGLFATSGTNADNFKSMADNLKVVTSF